MGISFSGRIGDGRINRGRKMNAWQKVLLFTSFLLSLYGVNRLKNFNGRLDMLFREIRSLSSQFQHSEESSGVNFCRTIYSDDRPSQG